MGIGSFKKIASLGSVPSFRSGPPPVAVDFGTASLKVLQLSGADNPSLVAAAQLETPSEIIDDPAKRLRFQLESLPKLVKSGGFKSQRAVCSIPASIMFCKHMQLQVPDGVSVGDILTATIAQQMECDAKALVTRHNVIRDVAPGKSEVVGYAVSRHIIEQLMGSVKASKLNPVGIHTEIDTIARGCGISTPTGEDAPVIAYIDLGAGTTKVRVSRGEELLFARVIAFGGLRLDQAVARQTQSNLDKARQRRLELETFDVNAPQPAQAEEASDTPPPIGHSTATYQTATKPRIDLTEPLEILADELRMCMRYHRALSPNDNIERIVFTGGEARHQALCTHLARSLRLPAQVADPMARVGRSGNEPVTGLNIHQTQPGWAVPLGLAVSPTDL